ncbi:MAG: hypothetical protein KAI66_12920, partial [Lentisphaeria bacterium]|nr:hypothetical protein [Lentisphaeria bacterium]
TYLPCAVRKGTAAVDIGPPGIRGVRKGTAAGDIGPPWFAVAHCLSRQRRPPFSGTESRTLRPARA